LDKDELAVLNADSPELWDVKNTIIPKRMFFGQERGDIRAKNIKFRC
jgi:hypothetical protein